MGQYYKAITQISKGKINVYDTWVITKSKKEYMSAKLTEHSWWYNPYVNAICLMLEKKAQNVAWLGDYCRDYLPTYGELNNLTKKRINNLHRIAWRENERNKAVKDTDYTLDSKHLVNHTKKQYIDCSAYYRRCVMADAKDGRGWCLHPLPLLTCIGNGLGGGDYNNPTENSNTELVGTWALDEISVTDTRPTDYEEISPLFKEKDWED